MITVTRANSLRSFGVIQRKEHFVGEGEQFRVLQRGVLG